MTSEDASDYGCSSKSREKRGREDWEKAEETGDEEEGEDEEKEVEGKKGSEVSFVFFYHTCPVQKRLH